MLALIGSGRALAQTTYVPQHRQWEVSGFAGRSFGESFEFPTSVSGDDQDPRRTVGMRYGSGYLFGLRINENLGDFWAADLEYTFANQPLHFTNLSPTVQNLSLSHYSHYLAYNVSFLLLPRTKRLRPYVDAGIGAALFYIAGHAKKEALDQGIALRDSWEFLFNWGGGFRYLVVDTFAVGFDVKNRLSPVPSYGLPPSARIVDGQYLPGLARNGVMHNTQVAISLTFQWDDD
jgi:opacity protein-like surface antigen